MDSMIHVENGVFSRVAEYHGVESRTIRTEINAALKAARRSDSPTARAFWSSMPADATAADVLRRIVEML